jgi:hypothetical protein
MQIGQEVSKLNLLAGRTRSPHYTFNLCNSCEGRLIPKCNEAPVLILAYRGGAHVMLIVQ